MTELTQRKWDAFPPPEESRGLRFLYHNPIGRVLLRLLRARWVSRLAGAFMDSRLSKPLIRRFVKKNGIDLSEFESDSFRCFNDCFCRRIKEGLRPIDPDGDVLIAPSDGLLSAYPINGDTVLPVKGSEYTVSSLLRDGALAERFEDGVCLVFRLCVNHYHRYAYPVSGEKGENTFIKGTLHTVRPIALRRSPVFVENCREYTLIKSDRFGTVAQIEVGAMLVGKIKNHHGAKKVSRGEEKGTFLYGGSTIILLLEKDAVKIPALLFENTEKGLETPVKLGEAIGASVNSSLRLEALSV